MRVISKSHSKNIKTPTMKKFLTKSQVQSLIVERKCSYYYEENKRTMHILGSTSTSCKVYIENLGYSIPFTLCAKKTPVTLAEMDEVIYRFKCTYSLSNNKTKVYIFGKNALLCEKELHLMGDIPYQIHAKAIQLV
jgi:hypothetical protein